MKRTLIAAAILSAMAAGAYAHETNCNGGCDPAALFSATHIFTDIDEDGFIRLHGSVSVASSAGATVNNTQSANLNMSKLDPPPQDYYKGTETVEVNKTKSWENASGGGGKSSEHSGSFSAGYVAGSSYQYTDESQLESGFVILGYDKKKNSSWSWNRWEFSEEGFVSVDKEVTHYIDTRKPTDLTASVGSGALVDATGNIGVNIAAGIDNVQSNTVALASMVSGPVLGTAQIFSTQSSSGSGSIGDFNLVASVGDGALAGATGNVGVNVTSGLGNVQNNSLALSSTTVSSGGGGEVIATDQNCQTADAKVTGGFMGSASLGMGALAGATGNIGVNIASGAGNLQHNGLAIAAVNR